LTTWKKLGVEAMYLLNMYLLNIPRVGEDLAIGGLKPIGA
jgi:hypothetical protein